MKNHKGKTTGIMMEGSVAHQESAAQEKKNLLKDMPVDDKASAMEMSPYKMGHEDSPAEFTGMSGGSALHQDADLSDMANLLFGEKKITKKQAKEAKEKVLANPMAKDTYVNNMLDKLQKEKPGMDPTEMMKYAKNSYEALPPEKK